MQVNMENDSDHFLSESVELQTVEEKIDLNNIVERIAKNVITPHTDAGGKSTVECPVCFVKFTQKNNLSRHMQRFHGVKPPRLHLQSKIDPSSPACSECGMRFTRKSNLFRHMKKFHEFSAPSKNPELPKIFSCNECDRKFTQWKNCMRHMRNIHSVGGSLKEEVEDRPPLESESHSVLEDNLEYVIEVDPFPVISPLRVETISLESTDLSESVSASANQLPESNSNHKPETNSNKNSKVICAECGMEFSTPFNLRRHTKRLHEVKDDLVGVVETTAPTETPLTPDCKLSPRTCPECQVSFSSPFNLRRHMTRVHGEQDSATDVAAKKSGTSDNRLFCTLCTESGLSFSTPFNLRRHVKRAHPQDELEAVVAAAVAATKAKKERGDDSDENRVSCPLCAESCSSFSTPSNMRRHMKRAHPQNEVTTAVATPAKTIRVKCEAESNENRVMCPLGHDDCGSFSTSSNMRRHIRRVHPQDEGDPAVAAPAKAIKVECDSNEHRVLCPLGLEDCGSFSTPSNMRRHIRRAHPEEAGDAAAAAKATTKVRCDSNENRLSCPLCLEGCVSFSTPSNLRRHMRKFHQHEEDAVTEIEEPMIDTAEILKCPRCEYRENRLNLYVHFNLVHGLQVVIEYQVFDSETQLDEWLSQISPEAQFVVRKSDSNRMVISCSHLNRADEFCPAEMIILTESDKCTVHHVKTHVHES